MIMKVIIINGGPIMYASNLRKGQKAVIRKVDVGHSSAPRLIEMGFTPGSEIEVIGSSPFGDPLLMRLRGYIVTARKKDLAAIEVNGKSC